MEKQTFTSLGELSAKLRIAKSQLAYYSSMGLLVPVAKVGRMNLYDNDYAVKRVKEILSLQKKGYKLEDIK